LLYFVFSQQTTVAAEGFSSLIEIISAPFALAISNTVSSKVFQEVAKTDGKEVRYVSIS
jgi:hypothetical protein